MGLHFHVQFEGDATYTEITELIRFDSVNFSTSLCNDKFKFSQDTVKAETIYNKHINDKFFSATKYLPCYVTYDLQEEQMYGYDASSTHGYSEGNNYGFLSEGRIFTGAIYPNTKEVLRDYPTEGVSFEIVDNAYLLDKDCEAFSIPEIFGDIYYVFSPSSPDKSLVHILLQQAGLLQEAIDDTYAILEEVNPIVFEQGSSVISKLVDEILYEYHHVYYFDKNGMFKLYNWKHDTLYIDGVIGESNIADSYGIVRQRNILDYDGYKAIFHPISIKENTLVYRDTFNDNGKLLLPTQAYPTEGELKDIKQEYSNNWLPDDSKIVVTYNHILDITVDDGIDIITEIYEKGQAQIVLKNNSTKDKYIKQFDIRADVYYIDGKEELLMPFDLTKLEEIKLKYVSNNLQVQDFVEALYNNTIKYGQYNYKFKSTNQYNIGVAYKIENRDYFVEVLIISKKHNEYEHIYEYECIGIGENIAQIGGGNYMKPSYNPPYTPPKTSSVFYSILNNVSEFPTTSTPATQGYVYIHGYTGEQVASDVDGRIRYPDPNDAVFFIDIPRQFIDLTDQVFWNIEIDRGFWTYLVLDNGTVTPVYYSIADTVFYDKYDNIIIQGIIIGQVKVGTIAPAHDTAIILESVPFDIGKTLTSIQTAQTADAFKYLSQANTPQEFEQYANNLGIIDFFTTMAVWELFTEKIKANQLQVGSGTKESGFVFYAMDEKTTGIKTIEAWSDGIKIFEINPITKNITIGNYNNGMGARWLNSSQEFVISGTGKFTGNIEHDALKTREDDGLGIKIDIPDKKYFSGNELYNSLSTLPDDEYIDVTGTIDGMNISNLIKTNSESSLIRIDTINYSSSYTYQKNINRRIRVTYNCISKFPNGGNTTTFKSKNGNILSSLRCDMWGGEKSTSFYYNISEGDYISVTNTGQSYTQYIKVDIVGEIVLFNKSDNNKVFFEKDKHYNNTINIQSPIIFNTNTINNYVFGGDILDSMVVFAKSKIYETVQSESIVVIDNIAKTVRQFLKMENEVVLYFNSGVALNIERIKFYNISGSIKSMVSTSAVITKNLEAEENAEYDIGYKNSSQILEKRYNNIYIQNNIESKGGSILGFSSIDIENGTFLPRSNPIIGAQTIAQESYYTPPRGLYNSSFLYAHRGAQEWGYGGGDGPYSGTQNTRVFNSIGDTTWYYAKF